MRQELLKLMRDLDAAAARLNAGLAAVAIALSIVVGAGLTARMQAGLDGPVELVLGP